MLSLCFILLDTQVHLNSSIRLIRTIVLYAVNRFVLTTIVGSVQTILHLIDQQNISALFIDYIAVHCLVYVNSFLAALNARNNIRGNPTVSYTSSDLQRIHGSTSVNLPGIQNSFATAEPPGRPDRSGSVENASGESFRQPLRKGTAVSMHVGTESYVMRDLDISKDLGHGALQHAV
ncbi:hypothetical protein VKT23_006149 [Stygiomarasmius scandens]|uniref:DUF6534 domain-containing protein n=1 Tax=Marasmiellus scandens TaxID=2682957 RepID=A0ABR1JV73_9AGAR